MLDARQMPTGTTYTQTVAFLAVAFLFSPAVLVLSRPFEYLAVSLAMGCSALCVTLAWVSWTKSSQFSVPTIAVRQAKAK